MLPQAVNNQPSWTDQQTRRSLLQLRIAVVVVVALLLGALTLDRARHNSRAQLQNVTRFATALRDAQVTLRTMQASAQAFLLTGDDAQLEPYQRVQVNLPDLWTDLQNRALAVGPEVPGAVISLMGAADDWRQEIAPLLEQNPSPDLASAQELVQRNQQLFDEIQVRYDQLVSQTREREANVERSLGQLATGGEVMLAVLGAAIMLSLMYGTSLVRRIGLIANQLQVRQDRQQGYTRVISVLNATARLKPLVQQALPPILESAGAQAGVIYQFADNQLSPISIVGLDEATLAPLKLGVGLPGTAAQQNRVLAVTDLPPETPYRIHAGVGSAPPRSIVSLPLRFGNDLLGVLVVASVQQLGETESQQLKLIASQLAIAMRNAQTFDETQRQREELAEGNTRLARLLERNTTLQEMGREMAAQRDLQTLLDLVCRRARRLLRADYAAVATVVDSQGSTRWAAIDGATTNLSQSTIFPPHHGSAGRTIDRAAPVVIEDFGNNPDFPPEEFPIHVAEGMHASLSVPLFRKDQAVGALIVAYRRPHSIQAEEIDLVSALAAYASVALENARLLSELSHERDLVAQRAIELQEKNVEVERANRLKSEFVANMSHELRTPLNSIMALSQILADQLDGELNAEQSKQVAIIERNAHHLLELINDILDLSKIESGKVELVSGPCDVLDVVQQVRSTMAPLAGEKGLDLRICHDDDLPQLYTDESKLKQILLNLLSNAVKFTERGSVTIGVKPGRHEGSGPVQDDLRDWITFEVVDTGIGIAPEDQIDIWQEFRQVDGSLSRRYQGTGLGLAIVRRLVAMLGGSITLFSQPGLGSTFTFSIPVRLPAGPQIVDATTGTEERLPVPVRDGDYTTVGPLAKPLVLVVDDDPEVLYLVEKFLRADGYEIAMAQDGDSAVSQARLLRPFAITLDIMLPGQDGWQVIQALKADPLTADIPIIVLSMLDNRELGYSLGATDYLVKPVSRRDLLVRLAQLHTTGIRKVLVVEDDLVEQRVLQVILQDAGLEVVTAPSGSEALAWLVEHTPDLITLDLMMPGMDGFEVLEAIRRRPELQTLPVLIITAKEILPEDRARLQQGIAAIIRKGPAQREALLSEVRAQLRRHREDLAPYVPPPEGGADGHGVS